jgi:hypothetical protein
MKKRDSLRNAGTQEKTETIFCLNSQNKDLFIPNAFFLLSCLP